MHCNTFLLIAMSNTPHLLPHFSIYRNLTMYPYPWHLDDHELRIMISFAHGINGSLFVIQMGLFASYKWIASASYSLSRTIEETVLSTNTLEKKSKFRLFGFLISPSIPMTSLSLFEIYMGLFSWYKWVSFRGIHKSLFVVLNPHSDEQLESSLFGNGRYFLQRAEKKNFFSHRQHSFMYRKKEKLSIADEQHMYVLIRSRTHTYIAFTCVVWRSTHTHAHTYARAHAHDHTHVHKYEYTHAHTHTYNLYLLRVEVETSSAGKIYIHI